MSSVYVVSRPERRRKKSVCTINRRQRVLILSPFNPQFPVMNRRQRVLILRTLLFLFILNAASLSVYFLLHPHPSQSLPGSETQSQTRSTTLKPWPTLPSFLPWSPPPLPSPRSCEAFFGHGFSNRIQILGPESEPDNSQSFLRCFYSETLMSSIWEMGRVRMDPGRIQMSEGGEELGEVIGRTEEAEMPKFEKGAFEIEGEVGATVGGRVVDDEFLDRYMPKGQIGDHTMRAFVKSMRIVAAGELDCSQWIEEPTLFVTRFEYANLFHTVTDWYSAYVSSRVTDLPGRPHLVFVDGHCKSQLEETWGALFSSYKYAKNFSGPVCFRHAVLSPLGYETALFKGLSEHISCQGTPAKILRENPDDNKTSRLSEFGEMLRAAFDLLDLPTESSTGHNILFVRREDYLAHPRHSGRVESRLSNEQEVFDAVKDWAANHTKCKINVVNGLFAHMSVKEQLRAIQEASVVIGAHGAGLTHLVAATPDTIVLEIISSSYRRPHFALISQWKGLEYRAVNLAGSYARPPIVIDELSSIMTSLKC